MVVNRGLIDAHLQDLDRNTALLERERTRTFQELVADPVRAYGIQHLLQICIETLANIANHLTSELKLPAPRAYSDSFENLSRGQIITDAELARRLVMMGRFRNLVVHRYWEVDMARVYQIVQNDLDDFRTAAGQIASFMADHPEL